MLAVEVVELVPLALLEQVVMVVVELVLTL
jgi:hypothetical protein